MLSRFRGSVVEVTFMNGDMLIGELLQADECFILIRSNKQDFYLPITSLMCICKAEDQPS